jgi:hypothetical protein
MVSTNKASLRIISYKVKEDNFSRLKRVTFLSMKEYLIKVLLKEESL